jgi:hypothetical protein
MRLPPHSKNSRSVDVCRGANLSPAFCIGCTRRLGLAGVLNGVTAQQGQDRRHHLDGGRNRIWRLEDEGLPRRSGQL